MKADLHLHTTASDGRLEPKDIVSLAVKVGLDVIAITDHDTIDGITSALAAAEAFPSFMVIPGVEINTDVPNGEVHILGYFIDYTDQKLASALQRLRDSREGRAQQMIAKLSKLGVNIELPEEQLPNTYSNISLSLRHFFVRKVLLVKYATAFVIMPGGLGTLDELTEVLTLMQTLKIKPFPVLLYGSDYWNGFLDWLKNHTLAEGFISEEDLHLLRVCDDTEEIVDAVCKWYRKQEISGRSAVSA